MKSVRIRSYSDPCFPAFGLSIFLCSVWMWENADQNNSEYGHFLCNASKQAAVGKEPFTYEKDKEDQNKYYLSYLNCYLNLTSNWLDVFCFLKKTIKFIYLINWSVDWFKLVIFLSLVWAWTGDQFDIT